MALTITPQGELYLCKTQLENDYKNQLTFSNANAQLSYFNSTIAHTFDNYTYIKKDNVIQVGKNIDEIIDCNYLFYKNRGFTNKYYYCFITNMEYVNENCTRITFQTDCFQTWQFQINYKKCFVEREHVNDDTIGKHTLPENVETGEFKINSVVTDSHLDNATDIHYYLATTLDISGVGTHNPLNQSGGGVYNGVYSGATYWRFTRENYSSLQNILQWIAHTGQLDGVVGLFLCPSFLDTSESNKVAESNTPISYDISVPKTYGLDGYTPKNNKLYTYPFCYLGVTNGGGDAHIYRYEFFSTSSCGFTVKGLLAPGGSIRLNPKSYNGQSVNNQEVLALGKFPICNYDVDMYTNWLTQNSVNIAGHTFTTDDLNGLSAISGAVFGLVGNVLTGNVIGAGEGALSGSIQIANAVMQKKQHELMSNAVRGDLNNGDIVTASNNNNFKFYRMSIRQEYAKIIDNYFSMYGYSINEVKIPNITGRTNWNYVKTIECNFDGNIPQTDLNIIKAMFNQGVTLWHNPATMLNYDSTNTIV